MMKRWYKVMKQGSWKIISGQLMVLVVVATALLMPAPFTTNELPAGQANGDLMISHWPTALLIQRTVAQEHRVPLWNPYYGGGQPLAADPLAALFYPPTHLVHFLSLRDYYLVLIMGHLVFAGLGMLLLARRGLGCSHLSSLVAAVSYMGMPRLISHLGAGHVTILQTVAWFPWLALACWATVQEPRRWGTLLGVCIGLTLLAGHPQMAYYGLLLVAGLAAWLLVQLWRRGGARALLRPVVGLVAAGVIGVLLAAVHLLPLLEFTALSTRRHALDSTETYPLLDFLYALVNPQPERQFPWEGMVTPGLAVFALALFTMVTGWRKNWPFMLGIVLVIGLAMGNSSPLYLLAAQVLPEFDRFRGLARVWFIGLFLIVLLAGMGTHTLIRIVQRWSYRGAVATGLLIVLVVACSLYVNNRGYERSNDVTLVTTPSMVTRTAMRLAGSGRIYSMQRNIPQVSAVQMQVRLAGGWNPLLIDSYVSYMQQAGDYPSDGYQLHIPLLDDPSIEPDARLLGLMNVSVVVSNRPLSDPRLIQAGQVDATLIYTNTADAGPAYLVRPGTNGELPALDKLQQIDSEVHVVTQKSDTSTFTFSNTSAAYLVIATPAFPGWTAYLDNPPVPVQTIAGVLPAIKVVAGTHKVSYVYDNPTSVRFGTTLSLVGFLIAFMWFIGGRTFVPSLFHLITSSFRRFPISRRG